MELKQYTISEDASVAEAVRLLDEGKKKIVFCTRDNCLTGAFTDGDIRRFLLRGGDLHAPVSMAMNMNPISITNVQKAEAYELIQEKNIAALPIVNTKREIVDIFFRDEVENRANWRHLPPNIPLVVMAGGKGTRLYPYTRILPKPLIPIGDIPILDHIMQRFYQYGIKDVYLVLNHKKEMIKAYYNEPRIPINIQFAEEKQFLGTGGGLSLLKGKLHSTFFLSNCDCLLDTDYACMYDYHKEKGNCITFILAMKNLSVPYGVLSLDEDGTVRTMEEKPSFDFLINTGIYLIEPFVLDFLEEDTAIDMPDIAKRMMEKGYKVGGYPITEKSWMDMGQMSEMQNMIRELGL